MTSNHTERQKRQQKKHYRDSDPVAISRKEKNERYSAGPAREDAYITAWAFAGAIATIGLCKLIGVTALLVATALAALAAWKLTRAARPFPPRVWFYCWIALFSTGIGLAIFEAQTMNVPMPVLGPDGILR